MNNASKKTSSFSLETKFSSDKVISTAVRFFSSSKNYKVQSQSSDWITFEPAKEKYPDWSLAMLCVIGGLLIGIGIFYIVRGNDILNSSKSFWGSSSLTPAQRGIFAPMLNLSSQANQRALLTKWCGIFAIIGGIVSGIGATWMAILSKLPQNITITVETLSGMTQVTIEHPSQKKVETLIGELIPLLPG